MQAILKIIHWFRLRYERLLIIRPGRFAEFGEGSVIRPPLMVYGGERVHIGKGVVIGKGLEIWMYDENFGKPFEGKLTIGDGCKFGNDLFITCAGEVTIGRDVLAADRLAIVDNYHEYEDPSIAPIHQPISDPKPVRIGDGAFFGVGCTVLPGVTVGERAYVGAGSVVTRDVPPWTIVAGNPARPTRRFDGSSWVPVGADD